MSHLEAAKRLKNLFVIAIVFSTTNSHAIEWWGKKVDSLRYVMSTQGFALAQSPENTEIYLGLEGFGIDRIHFYNEKLSRDQSYRFEDLIDASVGIQSIVAFQNFLIVGGIIDGFLALDPSDEYPSKKSKAHQIVFKPDPQTEVYSSVIQASIWKTHILLLTADQLVMADMPDPLTLQVRSQIALAPLPSQWKEFWATRMLVNGDDVYVLLTHSHTPGIVHLKLNESWKSIDKIWTPLPEGEIYVKSLNIIGHQLFVSQNQTLLIFDRDDLGNLMSFTVSEQRYFIDGIVAMPRGFGLFFWNNGFSFENSILFPPRRFYQVEVVAPNDTLTSKTLLFGSAAEEGFYVFEEY